jgi:diguanylate cyclase (GGDEF)-like protein
MVQIVTDQIVIVLLAFLAPGFVVGTLTAAAMVVTWAILSHPWKVSLSMAVVNAIGFGYVLSVSGQANWFVPSFIMVSLAIMLIVFRGFQQRNTARYQARLRDLVAHSSVFFWEVDNQTSELMTITGNVVGLTGFTPAELIGLPWSGRVEQSPGDEQIDAVPGESTYSVTHRDGTPKTFNNVVISSTPAVTSGIAFDISPLADAYERHQHQLQHDELTGLPNRPAALVELRRRLQTTTPFALLIVNLDRFREVNDILGHGTGDGVIRTVADRLRDQLDEAMYLARLSGDEFAILADTGLDDLAGLAGTVAEVVAQPIGIESMKLSLTSTIGVAVAPDDADDDSLLLQRADVALFEAKASSESFRRYQGVPQRLSIERLELLSELDEALAGGQIQAWFQPKFDLATNSLIGAEALARWVHPARGTLAPGAFLEVLSLSSQYRRFETTMIEQAVVAIHDASDRGASIGISVNISGTSLDADLEATVVQLLASHGVGPGQLTLEVTEDDFIDNEADSLAVFRRLSDHGVRFSIDDFGTGYSSFVRLRALPFDEVKIDRSFLAPNANDADHEMVTAMLDLADRLDLAVVAEGVEDRATVDFLVARGCETAQGYLWSPAKPRDEFLAMITADRP